MARRTKRQMPKLSMIELKKQADLLGVLIQQEGKNFYVSHPRIKNYNHIFCETIYNIPYALNEIAADLRSAASAARVA